MAITMVIFLSFLFVIISVTKCDGQSNQGTNINTPQGSLFGYTRMTEYGKVRVFMGIPYAKPPVGNLRLRPPEPASTFYNYNATYPRASCIPLSWSMNDEGAPPAKEDCLHLNVFTPETVTRQVPVMVWIHGGGYGSGTSYLYDPSTIVTRGNVIVVTINYRLALLGFFPGGGVENNLGLKDQILALKWVQENIAAYGGNPNMVTIFGESAGSQSVSFLTLSPKAKGLFSRAISQSGVATTQWIPNIDSNWRRQNLLKAGRELGCTASDVVDCAREIPIEKWNDFVSGDMIPFFNPAVDNDVIMHDFATNRSRFHDLDMIIGLQMMDGGMSLAGDCTAMYTMPCQFQDGMTSEQISRSVTFPSKLLTKLDEHQLDILIKTYNNWYPFDTKDDRISYLAAAELATDLQYRIPTNKTATNATRQGNKVYVYQFNVRPQTQVIPWVSPWTDKSDHAEDLVFLFSWLDRSDPNYNVSLNMIDMWTGFAKGQMASHWYDFTVARAEYLLIDEYNHKGAMRSPLVAMEKEMFWAHYETYRVFPEWWVTAGTGRPTMVNGRLVTLLMIFLVIFVQ